MARIRSIKPDFFTSLTVARLSLRQMVLFAGLWVYCDDHGRGRDDARLIKGTVWPQRDDITIADIASDLTELNVHGFIVRYEKNGSKILAIPTWRLHQRVTHPAKSKYPAPPRVSRKPHETLLFPLEALSPEVEVGSGSGSGSGSGTGNREQGHTALARQCVSITPQRIVDLWNEICVPKLAAVKTLTESRATHLRSRARPDRDESWWADYFARIVRTPFLVGESDRGWKADFDFAIRSEQSVARVLEGSYTNAPKRSRNQAGVDEFFRMAKGAT